MNLELASCLFVHGSDSHALRSHRGKMQNPGLAVSTAGPNVEWTLLGLQPGQIQAADPSDVDHLDIYIFRDSLVNQRVSLPIPTVLPGGTPLTPKYPWGSQGHGKPPIQPGSPKSRFQLVDARVQLAYASLIADTVERAHLHIDFELAPYPNPSAASLQQVHFGIESVWSIRSNRAIKNNVAYISMSHDVYADLYDLIMSF